MHMCLGQPHGIYCMGQYLAKLSDDIFNEFDNFYPIGSRMLKATPWSGIFFIWVGTRGVNKESL